MCLARLCLGAVLKSQAKSLEVASLNENNDNLVATFFKWYVSLMHENTVLDFVYVDVR